MNFLKHFLHILSQNSSQHPTEGVKLLFRNVQHISMEEISQDKEDKLNEDLGMFINVFPSYAIS